MNKPPDIAVLYHVFYEDSVEQIAEELKPLLAYRPVFIFNICVSTPGKKIMTRLLKQLFPGCFTIYTSNKGKDIGGKLAMFQLLLELKLPVDYILLIHDKKSLQAVKGSTWKKDLLKIIQPENLDTIFQIFRDNDKCGIIASKKYILSEPMEKNQFIGINAIHLNGLLNDYDIHPLSFEFVAGTMFWARAEPALVFFRKFYPLEIRKQLEEGNVIDNFHGTITHSWERLLSWMFTKDKLSITGI